MTQGAGQALVAMICYGLADLVYKRAARAGVPAHHFLMVQAWCFAPGVALYGYFTGTFEFKTAALWGAAAGLFAFAAFYNFARSLQGGPVSINAPIFRLNFAITAALAVLLLGELPTASKLAGLALALVAAWLLLGGAATGDLSARRETWSSLMRVLAATAALGIGNLLYKIGLRAGSNPATLLMAQAAVFLPLATVFAGMVDHGIRPVKSAWRHAPVAAALLVLAFIFMLESLARGEASVVVPIAQMGFVVTAVLGFVLLRESCTLRKSAGLVFAIAALLFLGRG